MLDSAKKLCKLRDRVLSVDATDRDRFQFLVAFKQHIAIQEHVSGAIAEAGRALQIMRAVKGLKGATVDANIKEYLEGTEAPELATEIAKKMQGLETLAEVNTTTRAINKATVFDMIFEGWINGLLTNPTTHVVNITGSAAALFYSIPERFVAEQLGEGVEHGEASAMLYGMVEGFKDGLRLAHRALKTGEPSDVYVKEPALRSRAITARNLGLDGKQVFGIDVGRAVDFLGEYVVRGQSRVLIAGDELMKAIAYRMELNAQAVRKARAEGLTGDALAEAVERFKRDPDPDMVREAVKFGREMTWTEQLGPAGQSLNRFVKSVPGLRYVAPFRRTPVNIAKFIAKRTPLAFLAGETRAMLQAGGPQRSLALARMALGTLTMLTIAELVSEGVITGGGPADPRMRKLKEDTGWQPYSIKIGDTYYSYSRLDPLGGLIGLGADMAEILGQMEDEDAEDLATAALLSISKNITSKTYLRGFTELINAISDPERYGENYIRRSLASFVPYSSLVRAVERITDPEIRYVDSLMDQYKANIPGFSKDLPPRVNIWGEPVVLEVGWYDLVNPFYHSRAKNAPISEEILKVGAKIGMPAKSIMGVKLEPWEYHRYVTLAGKEARIDGMTLRDALSQLFRSDFYRRLDDGPDGGKAHMIKKVIYQYRRLAREMLLAETPSLRDAVEAAERERQQAMTPNF